MILPSGIVLSWIRFISPKFRKRLVITSVTRYVLSTYDVQIELIHWNESTVSKTISK